MTYPEPVENENEGWDIDRDGRMEDYIDLVPFEGTIEFYDSDKDPVNKGLVEDPYEEVTDASDEADAPTA